MTQYVETKYTARAVTAPQAKRQQNTIVPAGAKVTRAPAGRKSKNVRVKIRG